MQKKFSRTWWGKQFIEALEKFTDTNRLSRGKTYAINGRIKQYEIHNNEVLARVMGSVNPYYGIYKAPLYKTSIKIKSFSKDEWSKIIKHLSSKAILVSKLLMNEMPDDIETVFNSFNLNLLPKSKRDFQTKCSCPDFENPCKHIAGVYYLLAGELDQNPFLMFELRGLSKDELQTELKKSNLGHTLLDSFVKKTINLKSSESLFTRANREIIQDNMHLSEYWTGKKRIPYSESSSVKNVRALLIKKQGDFPAFWKNEESFISVMESLYQKIKQKYL
ncbi:MAG: SWIM zinc finger family protein [Spirochaetota bacterium]|nr:SWIM zinc finger family protein [Spirochaetota bacterium]